MRRQMPSATVGYLMLDPGNCILCGVCEQVCPWDCIHMLPTGSPEERAALHEVEAGAGDSYAVFVVDDDACPRCSVCLDRCPTDTLYYARLSGDPGGSRTMAAVPTLQRAEVG